MLKRLGKGISIIIGVILTCLTFIRADLALKTAENNADPNTVVTIVSSWVQNGLQASVCCCVRVGHRWIIIDDQNANVAIDQTETLDMLTGFNSEISDVSEIEIWDNVGKLSNSSLNTLRWGHHLQAFALPVSNRCVWVVRGADSNQAVEALRSMNAPLRSAARLCMIALAAQMEDAEKMLMTMSLGATVKLNNALSSMAHCLEGSSSKAWEMIPDIIEKSINSIVSALGGTSENEKYSVDIFRSYPNGNGVNYSLPLMTFSARHKQIITMSTDSLPMQAMKKHTCLSKSFPGSKNGANAALYDSDSVEASAFTIRGDVSSTLVVLPVIVHEGSDVDSVDSSDDTCPGCISFTKTYSSADHPNVTDHAVSLKELTHIEALCAALMPTVFYWMISHPIDTLQEEEKFSISRHRLTSIASRSHINALDTFNAAWVSYVKDEIDGADESMSHFLAYLRGDTNAPRKNEKIEASSVGSLTNLAASCMGCLWASAVLINGPDDLVVMDDVGSVRHTANLDTQFSSHSEALEEKRLAQLFSLHMMHRQVESPGLIRADESFSEDSGVYMFQGVDICRSAILMATLSENRRKALEYSSEQARKKGYSSWTIVMMVLPLDEIISVPRGRRSLVLFGGREWHPKRDWVLDTSVRSLSSSFIVRIKALLSLMDDARVCSERVSNDMPAVASELKEIKSREDVVEMEYSAVKEISACLNSVLSMKATDVSSASFNLRAQLWHNVADTFQAALNSGRSLRATPLSFELMMIDGVCGTQWLLQPSESAAWVVYSSTGRTNDFRADIELHSLQIGMECPSVENGLGSMSLILRIEGCDLFDTSYSDIIRCTDDISEFCSRRAASAWMQQLRHFLYSFEKKFSRSILFQKLCDVTPLRKPASSILSSSSVLDAEFKFFKENQGNLRDFIQSFEFASTVSADSLIACPSAPLVVPTTGNSVPNSADPEAVWQESSAGGAAYFGSRSYWDKTLSSYVQSVHSLPGSSFVIPLALFKVIYPEDSSRSQLIGRDLLRDDDSSTSSASNEYLPKDVLEYAVDALVQIGKDHGVRILEASGSAVVERYLCLRQLEKSVDFTAEKRRNYLSKFSPKGLTLLIKGPLADHKFVSAVACDGLQRLSTDGRAPNCAVSFHTLLHLSVQSPIPPTVLNGLIGAIQASMMPLLSLKSSIILQKCTQDLQNVLCSVLTERKALLSQASSHFNSPIKLGETGPEKLFREAVVSDWQAMVRLLKASGAACLRTVADYEEELHQHFLATDISANSFPDHSFFAYVATEENKYTQCDNFSGATSLRSHLPAAMPSSHVMISTSLSTVICDTACDDEMDEDFLEELRCANGSHVFSRVVAGLIELSSSSPKKRARGGISPGKNVSFAETDAVTVVSNAPNPNPSTSLTNRHFIRISYYLPLEESELVVSASRSALAGTLTPTPMLQTGASSINPFRSFSPTSSFDEHDNKASPTKSFDFSTANDRQQEAGADVLFAVVFIPLCQYTSSVLMFSAGKQTIIGGIPRGASEISVTDAWTRVANDMTHASRRVFDRLEWMSRCTGVQLLHWVRQTHQTIVIQNGNRSLIKGHAFRGASFSDWTNENIKDLFEKAKVMSTHDIHGKDVVAAPEDDAMFDLTVHNGTTNDDEMNVAELSKMKQAVEKTLRTLLAKYQATAKDLRVSESSVRSTKEEYHKMKKRCDTRESVMQKFFERLLYSGLVGLDHDNKGFTAALEKVISLIHNQSYTWPKSDSSEDDFRSYKDDSVLYVASFITDRALLYKEVIQRLLHLLCELGHREKATQSVVEALKVVYASVNHRNADRRVDPMRDVDVFWSKSDIAFAVPFHCDEQRDIVVSARALAPMVCVKYPSMFQWVIASGQSLVVDEDKNGGISKSFHPKFTEASNKEVRAVTSYVPISCSLGRLPRDTSPAQRSSTRKYNSIVDEFDSSSKATVVSAVVEYTNNVVSSDDDPVSQRVSLMNTEFENMLQMMAVHKFGQTGGFTSDGGNPPALSPAALQALASPSKGSHMNTFDMEISLDSRRGSIPFSISIQLIQMLSSLSEVSHFDDDSARLRAMSSHIGNLTAGSLRASCGVFLISSGGETVGNIWKYVTADASVHMQPTKLTLALRDLLEGCNYTQPTQSEEQIILGFHSLKQPNLDDNKKIGRPEMLFAPVPTYGSSLLGDAGDGPCCRLLCPIYLPSSFADADTGVLQGYLLCESDRKFGPQDVLSVLGITKLASFVALAHSHNSNLIIHKSDKEENSKNLDNLRALAEHHMRLLHQHATLGLVFGRLENLRRAIASSDHTADLDIKTEIWHSELQALVQGDVSSVFGAETSSWENFSSEHMYDALGSAAVSQAALEAELLILSGQSALVDRSETNITHTDQGLCGSYRLQASRCREFTAIQAVALAQTLLQRLIERLSVDRSSSTTSPVIALHCCNGLYDSARGPVCVLVGAPISTTWKSASSGSTSSSRPVSVPDGGVWALIITFQGLQEWRTFVGMDRQELWLTQQSTITDSKLVGGLACAASCLNSLCAVEAGFLLSKERYNASLRTANIAQLKDQTRGSIVAVKKAREEGIIHNVEMFAAAVSSALSVSAAHSEESRSVLPNTFDISVPLRQLCADKDIIQHFSHRIVSARVFWNPVGGRQTDGSHWMTVNSADTGTTQLPSSDDNVAIAALLYALKEHHITAVSIRDDGSGNVNEESARLQNALDRLMSSNNCDINYVRRVLVSQVSLVKSKGIDSCCGHALVALYLPLSRKQQKEYLGTSTGNDASDATDFIQLFPAVLEVHVCVALSSYIQRSSGWQKALFDSAPNDGFISLYPNHLDDELLKSVLQLREVLSSEYRSIVLASHCKQAIEQHSSSARRATNTVEIISGCLQELHSDGGKMTSTLRRIEPLLCSINGASFVQKVYLCVVCLPATLGLTPNSTQRAMAPGTEGAARRGRIFSPSGERVSPSRHNRSVSPLRYDIYF